MEKDNGGSAFPMTGEHWNRDRDEWEVGSYGGMTLRDYFAASALRGMLASGSPNDKEAASLGAYKWADEMLKARIAE